MRTFFATARPGCCRWRRARPALARARTVIAYERLARDTRAAAHTPLASQAGLTLIEVLIAALIVALISLGTFSAFTAAGRSSADTRAHAQAVQIAGQDEERLRAMTSAELAQLESTTTSRAENGDCVEKVSGAWRYWTKGSTTFCENPTGLTGTAYTATVFAVTSSASYVSSEAGTAKTSLACDTSGTAVGYLQTTSSVTWPSLGTRAPVRESSIVNIAGLLVKVLNQKNEPVSGATVAVSGISPELSKTTPASGCVVFTGLDATSVKVTATKTGWVNENGEASPEPRTVPLAPNSITEAKFVIAEPGAIDVEFVEAGGTKPVDGSTFYALQTQIDTPPAFILGEADPAKLYTSDKTSQIFFPFRKTTETPPGEDPYTVFEGDGEANNPAIVTGGTVTDKTVQVEPDGSGLNASGLPAVKVELPKLTVNVYEGKSTSSPHTHITSTEHAMIINKGCESTTSKSVIARKNTSIGGGAEDVPYKQEMKLVSGELEYPYQPFAKELVFCVVWKKGTSKYYKYESPTPFENGKSGYSLNVYMEEAAGSGYSGLATSSPTCP